MALIPGKGEGGQAVWELPDGQIAPVRVILDTAGNVIGSITDNPKYFEDTNFVAGDSPKTLDLNAALSRNATQGSIINDGAGSFTVAFSSDGSTYGDAIKLETQEQLDFSGLSVDSIKITHSGTDSAYRAVFA
jgi:hypothetical protein